MLNQELMDRRQRVIMIVSHDPKMAIGKEGELIKRHSDDLKWFKRMTMNRVCIVGRRTFSEVCDLPGRSWFCLTRNANNSPSTESSDNIYSALMQANIIANARSMDSTTVVVGGAEIYNAYLEANLVDAIYATVWPDDLNGTTFINDYRKDPNWIKINEWPLEETHAKFDHGDLAVPMVEYWVKRQIVA